MKSLILTTVLLIAIAVPAMAGDIPGGGKAPPPPPPTSSTGFSATLTDLVVSLIIRT